MTDLHMFHYKDKRLVYDVNSGSLHEVDELAWELIRRMCNGGTFNQSDVFPSQRYSPREIEQAKSEIDMLKDGQMLFSSPPPGLEQGPGGGRLKALCLFMSRNCNLQCSYCFARPSGEGKDNNGNMNRDVAFRAVDLLLEQEGGHFCEIDFFGGEPLLNFPLIREVVDYAQNGGLHRNKEFTFTLTTNALLLGEEVAAFLNKENISVILSLDGRPAVHDRMRRTVCGGKSYARVVPHMHKFLHERGYKNYFIRGTYTAHNLDFCKDVEHLLAEGFDSLSLEPVVAKAGLPYALQEGHISRLEEEYDRLVELYLERRNAGLPFHFYHFDMDLEKGPCVYKRLSGCGAGRDYLAVASDGTLYPCHQFVGTDVFCLGKLGNGFLELNNEVGEQVACSAAQRDECSHCWARYLCGGGCAAASYFLQGDLYRNDTLYCTLQRIRLERALYLQAV